jgi:hypothetical protein
VPIIEQHTGREPTGSRIADLEQEVEQLNRRVDALLEAVSRMARQHYRYPLLPENTLSSALHDARRR